MTTHPLLSALLPLVDDLSRELAEEERYRRLLAALRVLIPSDATALLRLDGEQLIPLAVDGLSADTLGRRFVVAEHPRFQFIYASITNEVVMDRLASTSDVIFHLAAAVGVELIVKDPVNTLETNIQGTEVMLRLARRYRTKILIASTSEVYGKSAALPFREDADRVMGPTTKSRWSYAESKAIDEFLALAYHKQYDLPIVICRFFNTVGPRQTGSYGMVIPRLVEQALAGQPLTVYGSGQQSRCFLHAQP